MRNYFARKIDLVALNNELQNNPYLNEYYFAKIEEHDQLLASPEQDYTIEQLLDSFIEESEATKKIKITVMKELKTIYPEQDKMYLFNLACSYINKYKYNLKLLNDKDIIEFNKQGN